MSPRGERILIADDSKFIQQLLSLTLEKEGFEVCVASNGREALDMTRSKLPRLILMDDQMPELTGLEVCEQLVTDDATAEIPVLFLTAQPEIERKVKGLRLTHVDFLPKPFQAPELLSLLRIKLRAVARQSARREKLAELTAELEQAQRIQQNLLPGNQLLPGLEVVGKMQSARHVGGDYYDVFQQDQHAVICIGDVSGKGIPAAMVMVMIRTFLHSQEIHDKSPMDILNAVNAMLHDGTEPGVFMSLLLLKWDAEVNKLGCCGAGHEHLLIHRVLTQEVETVGSGGSVLGLRKDLSGDFYELEFELEPGDTVLLYTDGVTEALRMDGEQFGLERLENALERQVSGSTRSLVEGVFDEVLEFVGNVEQHDDITLLCLRRESHEEYVL